MTDIKALVIKAGAQLLDAAGMLRIEAAEWQARGDNVPSDWNVNERGSWAARCERIAETNNKAALVFQATAKELAALAASSTLGGQS